MKFPETILLSVFASVMVMPRPVFPEMIFLVLASVPPTMFPLASQRTIPRSLGSAFAPVGSVPK